MESKKPRPKYSMWQNSGFMISLAWQTEKQVLVLCVLQALVAVALSLVSLLVTPSILQAVESQVPIQRLLGTIAGFTGLLILLSGAQAYIADNTLFGRVGVRTRLISMLLGKTTTTSYPNTEKEEYTQKLRKAQDATSSNQAATEAIWRTLTQLLQNSLGFVIYLLLLSGLDWRLMLVITVTAAAGYFVSKQIMGYGYRHREEEAAYSKKVWYINEVSKETVSAKDIRIFGLASWLQELAHKSLAAYRAFHRKAAGIYVWSHVVDLVLSFLRSGIAYAYLIGQVLTNGLSASEFLLYFTAVDGFTNWVTGLLDNLTTLHRQSLELCTIREYLEAPEPFRFEEGKALAPEAQKAYEIRLDDVSFRYPGAEQDTLSHINLTLHPGEKLAIVGLNGAGKTTLIKLVCGFLDPTDGRVLLNGEDIRVYNRRDYYQMFSAVFQNFSVLAGSIAMNVAQSEDAIDRPKVERCLAQAGLTAKIESLPKQYDTLLCREVYEDAVSLSGGEMQRLMLARALYKDAPVVVLDEPTAALDPLAEADMYQKYHEMTEGRSSIYISHRLASTRFCDRIILIDGGGIAEEGTHAQLMADKGRYAELFEVQSQYYQEMQTDENEEKSEER